MALFRLMFTKVNASAHVRNDANRISASRSRKDCKLDTLDTLISIYKYEIIIIIGKSDKENDFVRFEAIRIKTFFPTEIQ